MAFDKEQYSIDDLLDIMQIMRDPASGCKWTQDQTWGSLVSHTLEEAYEVVDAVENQQPMALKGELADLLNQVVFYAHIAKECGLFSFQDVVDHLCSKLIHRHPNVFSDDGSDTLSYEELEQQWEAIKQQERHQQAADHDSILDSITKTLPALSYTQKLQKKVAHSAVGQLNNQDTVKQLQKTVNALESSSQPDGDKERALKQIGHMMFYCVSMVRQLDGDAETVMRQTAVTFENRFRSLEQATLTDNKQLSPDALKKLWCQIE